MAYGPETQKRPRISAHSRDRLNSGGALGIGSARPLNAISCVTATREHVSWRSLTAIRESRIVELCAASTSKSNGTKRRPKHVCKHGVSFTLASTILRDPLAVTTFDEAHSETEERWITVGGAITGECLVVVHTWTDVSATSAKARIISAREADNSERGAYEEGL